MKKYIQYNDVLRMNKFRNNLKRIGAEIIPKEKSKILVYTGLVCLGIAVIPNGLGAVFYPLGFMCLGINKLDLFLYKEKIFRKIKFNIGRLK